MFTYRKIKTGETDRQSRQLLTNIQAYSTIQVEVVILMRLLPLDAGPALNLPLGLKKEKKLYHLKKQLIPRDL